MNLATCFTEICLAGKARFARLLQDRSGVSAIEFAILMPILLIGVIIAVDLGRGIIQHIELTGAARAATQFAQVKRPVQQDFNLIEQAALDALSEKDPSALDGITVSTSLVCECSGGGAGQCTASCPDGEFRETYLTIQVSQEWDALFEYPVVSWPITLTGESTMRFQ